MKRSISKTILAETNYHCLVVVKGTGPGADVSEKHYYSSRELALKAKEDYKKIHPDDFVYEPSIKDSVLCIESGSVPLDKPLKFDCAMSHLVVYSSKNVHEATASISQNAVTLEDLKSKLDEIDPLVFDYKIKAEPLLYMAFSDAGELVAHIRNKVTKNK